jgi:hypothetical protein
MLMNADYQKPEATSTGIFTQLPNPIPCPLPESQNTKQASPTPPMLDGIYDMGYGIWDILLPV